MTKPTAPLNVYCSDFNLVIRQYFFLKWEARQLNTAFCCLLAVFEIRQSAKPLKNGDARPLNLRRAVLIFELL
jgi:hypothetical protein